jgi:HEAT repeat protein
LKIDIEGGIYIKHDRRRYTMDDLTFQDLIAALKHPDHHVRCKSALALGKSKDKRAVEPLIGAMMDANEFVRMDVACALGQTGDVLAVEPLIHALHDVHGYVRREAALALGAIGDNRAIQPLIDNIRTDDKSAAAAAKALSYLTGETVQAILLKWS